MQQPSRRPMLNQAPKQALVRRSYQMMQFAALFVSAGIFFFIVGLALYAAPLATEDSAAFAAYDLLRGFTVFLGVGLALGGIGMAARAATWKTDNDLAKLTGEALKPLFDDRYSFIRNISKRGLGYIDAIMIGPEGILVFRILDLKGEYLNEGNKWLKARRGEWEPLSSNPTQNVLDDIENLDAYLSARGLPDFPIYGVVVFTRTEPELLLRQKPPNDIPALYLRNFKPGLQDTYFAHQRIDDTIAKRVSQLLYDG